MLKYKLGSGNDADFADSACLLFNDDLGINPLLEQADMRNHANGFVVLAKTFQSINGDLKGFGIETAKAFVNEQGVDTHGPASKVRKAECQCQAG